MVARALAADQGGVVALTQLRDAGLPPWFAREQVRIERWRSTGRGTVALHTGPLDRPGLWWQAVLELGPRAALAGVSALQHDGVTIEGDGLVHVLVPKGAAPRHLPGVVVHESRRYREEDVLTTGLRRTTPAVSAVQAALWARSNREAALMLMVVVGRRLATSVQVAEALEAVRRHPRRAFLRTVAQDLQLGVQSLGELDVARAMRSRGLPEPERQAVRRRATGVQYLDADFPGHGITMEIDGAQHAEPEQALADCLRDLDLGVEGRTVVRIPLTAWRLDQDSVLDGLERLFASRGWHRAA